MSDEVRRGFYHHSRSWYGPTVSLLDGAVDDIQFGLYHDDGSTTGKMTVEWHELGGKLVPRLVAFDDAWRVLADMPDVTALLGELHGQNVTPQRFAEQLLSLGLTDITKTEPS